MNEWVLCGYFLDAGSEPLALGIANDWGSSEVTLRPSGTVPSRVASELLLTPQEVSQGLTWEEGLRDLLSAVEDGDWILGLGIPQVVASRMRRWIGDSGRSFSLADVTSAFAVAWPMGDATDPASLCQSAGVVPGPLRSPAARAQAVLQTLPALRRTLASGTPLVLLAECIRQADLLEWPRVPLFQALLRTAEARLRASSTVRTLEDSLNTALKPRRPPRPDASVRSGVAAVEEALGPGGAVSRAMAGYESRPRQLEMAMSVAAAIDRDEVLLAEAGTGIGKSLAYLVPLALHVVATGERAVVSTATRTLQDQLLEHDIPMVRRSLDLDLAVTVMKGRRNYLCLRKLLDAYRGSRDSLLADHRLRLLPVLSWALRSETLDLAELRAEADVGSETQWSLGAGHESCVGFVCGMRRGCALTRLRAKAAASDVIIINHALWFAGGAAGAIPDVTRVVFDEAHVLEDVATEHYTLELSGGAIERLVLQVWNPGGTTGLMSAARSVVEALPPPRGALETLTQAVCDTVIRLLKSSASVGQLADALAEQVDPGGRVGRTRLRAQVTELHAYVALVEVVEDVCVDLRSLASGLERLASEFAETDGSVLGQLAAAGLDAPQLESAAAGIVAVAETAEEITALDDPSRVFYLERMRTEAVLRAAPIEVGERLATTVFAPRSTVVLTSATLSVSGDMGYFEDRLGLAHVSERLIAVSYPSEFDYPTQACLCVPTDIPDPRESGWIDRIGDAIVELVAASRGRALILFTSRAHLEAVYGARRREIEALGITVYSQLANLAPGLAGRQFSRDVNSVLFATRSFFEGVDIPGESLSCVVLTRLPFAVPTDPIVEARWERVEERGHSAMDDYYVPQAVITFRQAFGRLIRCRTDRGAVVVLDPRVVRRPYGQRFLASVPECPVVRTSLRGVTDRLSRFFAAG